MSRSFVVAALVLAGCTAPDVWTKSGASESDIADARSQCRYASRSDARPSADYGTAVANTLTASLPERQMFQRCMRAAGYSLQEQP